MNLLFEYMTINNCSLPPRAQYGAPYLTEENFSPTTPPMIITRNKFFANL